MASPQSDASGTSATAAPPSPIASNYYLVPGNGGSAGAADGDHQYRRPTSSTTTKSSLDESTLSLNSTLINSAIGGDDDDDDNDDEDLVLHGESIIESILNSQMASSLNGSKDDNATPAAAAGILAQDTTVVTGDGDDDTITESKMMTGMEEGDAEATVVTGDESSLQLHNSMNATEDEATITESKLEATIVTGDEDDDGDGNYEPTILTADDDDSVLFKENNSSLLLSSSVPSKAGRSVSFAKAEDEDENALPSPPTMASKTDSRSIPMRFESDPSYMDHVKEKQINAAQTAFTALPAVVSFAGSQQAEKVAMTIKERFPTLIFRSEGPSDEISFNPLEFRLCVLSLDYATKSNSMETASKSAEIGKLIIICLMDMPSEDDESSELSEEWQSLCFHSEWCFPGSTPELLEKALDQSERYILEQISTANDEYTAVLQIDDYVVLSEIGHGAQGIVYKAQHDKTGEIRAIKELRNMAGKISPEAKMEIAVMKKLDHPNVAKLIAVYQPAPEISTSLFLVMEFIEGGSLMTDMDVWNGTAEPLGLDRAQNVFQQLVKGISYLHHMGVLHRDIKPSNILGHRDSGAVKVSDFGVSSFTKVQKSARILGEDDIICVGSCGTPAFLPPEASGAGFDVVYHGRPADVWSLGIAFYALLSGHLPFKGTDRASTAKLICNQKLKFPSSFPSQAKELITKMLEKDPAKRITLTGVCNHPWINVVNWKADLSNNVDDPPADVSPQDVAASLSLPQSLRKVIKKRSQSFFRYGGSVMRTMIPLPSPATIISFAKSSPDLSSAAQTTQTSAAAPTEAGIKQEKEDKESTTGGSTGIGVLDDLEFVGEMFKDWFCTCGGDRKG